MNVCRKCVISGRVQGVFFRASARAEAEQLGVEGYARNLPDGSVEVLACGEESAVDLFREWLWVGPSAARIENVQCQGAPAVSWQGFRIL